jgi:cytochrome c556
MKIRTLATSTVMAVIIGGSLAPAATYAAAKEKRFPLSQYRHDVMEHFSYGFKKIDMIFKKKAGSREDVAAIAAIMASAATMTKRAFEKDTRTMEGHTEAKDKIWDNWEDFAKRLDTMEADAAAFAQAAKSGDMALIGPAMQKVGKSCKSCHDEYKDD